MRSNRPRAGADRSACVFARAKTIKTSDNRRLSGGLPHSEIPGSKGALASPGLIAECHVLHRLLLPRHPPNALLALDPIQKKTGHARARLLSAPQRFRASERPPVSFWLWFGSHLTRHPPVLGRGARVEVRDDPSLDQTSDLTVSHIIRLGKTANFRISADQPHWLSNRQHPRMEPWLGSKAGPPLTGHAALFAPRRMQRQFTKICVSCYCSLNDVNCLILRSDSKTSVTACFAIQSIS